jgi:hypothetical protein
MSTRNDLIIMRAIAICYKPYLRKAEAMIYCSLASTQFLKKCNEFKVYKTKNGYYARTELDRMLNAEESPIEAEDGK